jgi:hypothetical protein
MLPAEEMPEGWLDEFKSAARPAGIACPVLFLRTAAAKNSRVDH